MLAKKLSGSTSSGPPFKELGTSAYSFTSTPASYEWYTAIPDVPTYGLSGDTLYVVTYSYGPIRWIASVNDDWLNNEYYNQFQGRLIDGSTTYLPSQAMFISSNDVSITLWAFDDIPEDADVALQFRHDLGSGYFFDAPSFFCISFAVSGYDYPSLSGRARAQGLYEVGEEGSFPLSVTNNPSGIVLGALATENDRSIRFTDSRMSADYIEDLPSAGLALLAIYPSEVGETVSTSITFGEETYSSALFSFNLK